MAPTPRAYAPRSAPQAPVSAPLSEKAVSDFMQLKESLANITSWELALGTEEILQMYFSEAANGEQARILLSVLK